MVTIKQSQQHSSQEDCETRLNCYSDKNSSQVDYTQISKMQCIGQFAKGFVISYLDNELFIVDQHAAS